MKRIVALVATLMVALGIGVLAQATPAAAAVSGGGCTPSGDRDGYHGWVASACISLNTSTQQAEWDGYIDIHGSHCYTLTLQLYYNGTRPFLWKSRKSYLT
jgi:hypothetical protein